MYLKVIVVQNDPPPVHDHDVPMLVASLEIPRPPRPQRAALPESMDPQSKKHLNITTDWDHTTRQLLPYINGYNQVSKIAADTNVEKMFVKSCIQNLVFNGVVTLIPMLKCSNMYRATPKLIQLFKDLELLKACLVFLTHGTDDKNKPVPPEVLKILCALKQGKTLRAVCERYSNSGSPTIYVRRLIAFAQMHGLITCFKK